MFKPRKGGNQLLPPAEGPAVEEGVLGEGVLVRDLVLALLMAPSELPSLAAPASPEPTISTPRMESRLLSSLLRGAPSTAHAGTSPVRTQEKLPTVPSIPMAHSSGICSKLQKATSGVKVSL